MENRKCLVIGDTHFSKSDYIEVQMQTIIDIIESEHPKAVIFLGDIFNERRPDPFTLIRVKKFFDHLSTIPGLCDIFVLRGNHDTASKSDENIKTVLSLYDSKGFGKVKVIVNTNYLNYHGYNFAFIPHYENEELIKKSLDGITSGDNTYVFGHFGFLGGINTAGDQDGFLRLSDFKYRTFLGHIHKPVDEGLVSVVGTPYSTSFSESDNPHRYGIIDGEESYFKDINKGIRHLVVPYDSLKSNKDFINDPNYHTLLKIYVNQLLDKDSVDLRDKILEEYNVKYVDIKYVPLSSYEDKQSNLVIGDVSFELNDDLIERYCEENNSSLPKDLLLDGFRKLKNAYKETKDS